MKSFIESFLLDYLADNPDIPLSTDDIPVVTEYMWMNFDCSDMYYQFERLLSSYLAKK